MNFPSGGGGSSSGIRVGYDGNSISINGGDSAPLTLRAGEPLQLHIFVDGGIVEVVANGKATIQAAVNIAAGDQTNGVVSVFGPTGSSAGATVDAWSLESIWEFDK
jgi:hypothetical protein